MSPHVDAEEMMEENLDQVPSIDEAGETHLQFDTELSSSEEPQDEEEADVDSKKSAVGDPITTYLREIGSVPLLSREREVNGYAIKGQRLIWRPLLMPGSGYVFNCRCRCRR
jgi:hypothetical protein